MRYEIRQYTPTTEEDISIVEEYRKRYKEQEGRTLPKTTALIRTISVDYPLGDNLLEGYIGLHRDLIGGECLRTERRDGWVILYWLWADRERLRVLNLRKGDIHHLREAVTDYIRKTQPLIRRLLGRHL